MESRFDHSDPYFVRVQKLALALPGVQERLSVGHPTWFTKKVFLWWGMSHKVDGEWVREDRAVAVLLPPDERLAVLDAGGYVPGYIGPSGWVGVRLDEDTDWQEIAELIEESFRTTASARLVAQLDARP